MYNFNMLDKKTDKEKGILALVVLALVFASMGLFARYLATSFSTYQQVYLRLIAAFILSSLTFRNQIDWQKFKKVSKKDWGVILLRAISYSLFGIALFTQAIIITKYSNVSFIGSLPMTAVLGFILIGETFTWKKAFWVLIAFLGVMLISVKDYSHLLTWGHGEVLTLISTVFFSLSYVARKWQSDFLNNKELTVINFVFASLVVFLVSVFRGEGLPIIGWSWGVLVAVLGAGLFNVFNIYLTNYGFQKVEAVLASNILTLEALFAVILGFSFYREVPLIKDLFGGVVIISAVIAMNKSEAKKQTMKNAIILHAMDDSPENHWYPWLKSQLEHKGLNVWAPQLPEDKNPQINIWVPFIMKGGKLTEDTVIIGHSAGASVILSVLEELKIKISQAILVAGFSFYPGGDGILKPSYNWGKIKANVGEMIFINSDNDPYGHDDTRGRIMLEMLNMDGGIQIVMKGQGHFCSNTFNHLYKEFPLLLRLIK